MAAAVTDSYATAEKYRAVKRQPIADEDDILDDHLIAVSRYIDGKLNRFFTRDAAVVARTLTPGVDVLLGHSGLHDYDDLLYIPDVASLTGFAVKLDEDRDGSFAGDTALPSTDYTLRCGRGSPYGPEPWPYTQLLIPTWSVGRASWLAGYPLEVSATWGWPAVPKAIEVACIELTAILRLESARATRTLSDMGGVLGTSRQANDIVDELLAVYGRVEF